MATLLTAVLEEKAMRNQFQAYSPLTAFVLFLFSSHFIVMLESQVLLSQDKNEPQM